MVNNAPGASTMPAAGPRRCNSCDGWVEDGVKLWVCRACQDDWRRWQREAREAERRYVARMMGPRVAGG